MNAQSAQNSSALGQEDQLVGSHQRPVVANGIANWRETLHRNLKILFRDEEMRKRFLPISTFADDVHKLHEICIVEVREGVPALFVVRYLPVLPLLTKVAMNPAAEARLLPRSGEAPPQSRSEDDSRSRQENEHVADHTPRFRRRPS